MYFPEHTENDFYNKTKMLVQSSLKLDKILPFSIKGQETKKLVQTY